MENLIDQFIAAALANLTNLPQWIQFVILLIATIVTIAAHIAPYTPTAKDDFLAGRSSKLMDFLRAAFNIVAGNYRNAKNAADDKLDKLKLKDAKK